MKRISYCFLLFFLIFFSCKEKEVLPMNGVIDIAPSFQPFVDDFIAEAALRGRNIDFSDTGLSIQFSPQPLGIAARCLEFGDDRRGSHQIEFDENLWRVAAPERRAFLVFHELGHCELNRPHQNDQLPNEEWLTMMQGLLPDQPLSNKNSNRPVVFSGFRKTYYLDELFGLNPSAPDWTNFQTTYNAIAPNQKNNLYTNADIQTLQEAFELTGSNYEVEILVNRQKTTGDIGIKVGDLDQALIFKLTDRNELLIELAGKVSSEIEFYNGGNVILSSPYRLYFCDDLPLGSVPKLTIRQQNGIASFFLNEVFLFHIDALETTNILVGAIQQNENLLIERVTISAL